MRPPEEILATLDANASLDAMPFMPEMLQYVGRRFMVSHRVEKICDTAGKTFTSRRMRDTVFLEDLRCDGSGHDGCQARCRIYWKEAWLRRVGGGSGSPDHDEEAALELLARTTGATRVERPIGGEVKSVYRCQATEANAASTALPKYDLAQYVREVRVGNVSPSRVATVLARALLERLLRALRLRSSSALRPPRDQREEPAPLGLAPGELVQVRPCEEIAATVDASCRTRGLLFDHEMLPYCGGTYQVLDRVERFIDESTGEMVELKSDCLVLDGVVCSGERSVWRWFCPRAIYPWWREAWLRRVDEQGGRITTAA